MPTAIQLDRLRKEWWRGGWWPNQLLQEQCFRGIVAQFQELIAGWPLEGRLRSMLAKQEGPPNRWVGPHVAAVIASLNEMLPDATPTPTGFFVSVDPSADEAARSLVVSAYHECWGGGWRPPDRDPGHAPYFGPLPQHAFAQGFVRIAALFHDIGKTISDDKHVSRGVHVILDVTPGGRRAMEGLFGNLWDAECFFALLKHHDVYGCLCTGEASLPALSDMISWTSPVEESNLASGRSALAQISFLNWLNIADSDASLLQYLGGITTVEAMRYLTDWKSVTGFMRSRIESGQPPNRGEFTDWALSEAGREDRTIERITRLVATCFRTMTGRIDQARERQVRTLVARELQALHGPRFRRFCRRFARFVKLDYALRFFYKLMDTSLDERGARVGQPNASDEDALLEGLRTMISRTCAILARVVEEYGHLVDGDQRAEPRLGVDLSKLMAPNETGQAICEALKNASAAADVHRWIVDEISIWLYGD